MNNWKNVMSEQEWLDKTTPPKWYIPPVEDIRIGYEIESHEWSMDEAGIPELNYDRWVKKVLDKNYVKTLIEYGTKRIRVPYLTKEQIEAEGWKHLGEHADDRLNNIFEKDGYFLHISEWIKGNIGIRKQSELSYSSTGFLNGCLYFGKCPSINEFRQICKLLNI